MLTVLMLVSILAFAQTRQITGRVVDEAGQPVIGASVSVKGAKGGVSADAEGNFTISAKTGDVLQVSAVGAPSKEVTVTAGSTMQIALTRQSSTISEVVVTGYSTVRKSEYSGAATKVTADKINFVPMASFDQILQGRAPGLLVTAGSGQPGAAARVQLRGQSSITGGNDPLYVLDGTFIEASVFQSLNPNDFESVDVLRDATATAQYGNRGSGGVIVITTKKGRVGKPVLSYNTQIGITQPGKQRFEMMNSAELLQFQEMIGLQQNGIGLPGWVYSPKNPANANMTAAELARNAAILDSLRGINTDWAKIFQRHGKFSSHDLSLSGGSGGTRFYLSGGYYNEEGIGLRSDLKRYTVRANLEHKSDKLTVGFNSTVGYTKRNFVESENSITLANPFAAVYLALPFQKLYNPDGTTVAVGPGQVGPNAFDRVNSTAQNNGQLKANVGINLNYNPFRHIFVGGSAGIDYRQTIANRSNYPGTYSTNQADFPIGPEELTPSDTVGRGSYNTGLTRFVEYVARANAAYRNTFNAVHDVDVQVISEFTKDFSDAFSYTGFGINPKLLNTPAGITPGSVANKLIPVVGGSIAERALYAGILIGRYTYAGKYTFNVTLRRDGSSQLPRKNRFQNFYAVGGTWSVLKEDFAQNWKQISDLRVRLSYGTSASADNFPGGYYPYQITYGFGTYNGATTIVPSSIGNPDLTWEKVGQLNLGVDYAFFRNRIRGTIDIYDKKSKRNMVTQTLPLTGYLQVLNAATVSNKGIEITLSGDIIRNKDVTWTVGGNVSYNKNQVVDLGQVKEFEQGTELIKVGLPLGSHYIVKWGGVDAATGAPLYWTKPQDVIDASGKPVHVPSRLTNVYSDADKVSEFGTYNAPWIGGFNSSVSYRGFSLDAFFTFQKGFSRYNNQDYFQQNHAFALQGYNVKKEMLDMWQRPGDITNIQSSLYQRESASKDIQDASFLKFRNLTVSYTLPAKLWRNQKYISNIRIFGQVQNLYTWTNWTGFEPEDDDNIAQYEYPSPRTYTFGLNVSFK
jgi:TonB-linked SusC/RagA family outer membrane protein